MLVENDRDNLRKYQIMQRINPPEIDAYMVRGCQIVKRATLSELGIYSTLLLDSKAQKILDCTNLGSLLRTKATDTNEGGVNSG